MNYNRISVTKKASAAFRSSLITKWFTLESALRLKALLNAQPWCDIDRINNN
jgi:hypothetical protein